MPLQCMYSQEGDLHALRHMFVAYCHSPEYERNRRGQLSCMTYIPGLPLHHQPLLSNILCLQKQWELLTNNLNSPEWHIHLPSLLNYELASSVIVLLCICLLFARSCAKSPICERQSRWHVLHTYWVIVIPDKQLWRSWFFSMIFFTRFSSKLLRPDLIFSFHVEQSDASTSQLSWWMHTLCKLWWTVSLYLSFWPPAFLGAFNSWPKKHLLR